MSNRGSHHLTRREIININLSFPFMMKNRCKECSSLPCIYYYIRNRSLFLNPRKTARKYKRMCTDHYFWVSPKDVDSLVDFSHTAIYKGYSPAIYRSRGNRRPINMTEYLMCECGATSWAFNDKSVRECPEVVNRKSRGKYPQRFEF